jgi:hypothetical protein
MPKRLCVLTIAVLALPGCGKSGPAMAEVEGLVTVDGKPAPQLKVEFQPEPRQDGVPPYRSSAFTDEAGRYRLTCETRLSGALVGKHRVTVTDLRSQPDPGALPDPSRANPQSPPKVAASKKPGPRVPDSYGRFETTQLRQEVRAGGVQTINLELKSK